MAKKKIDPATEAINAAIQDIEDILGDLYHLGFDDGYERAERDNEKEKK